ncbi:hypothetical protein [Spiroplasma monobiae]|uniref:Uncharacterized protein n=1 Tax=Spiroplasma monobiae MQ-1 TaxID=1336748 RepID=A0A2K9LU18_SPISQ|nr:hypothetical protein [Spiroplasma monobiae]AUM62552.1 hypothetical protein SMONO_v1c03030 [Spiroplasma monobiae MQ-1]
MSCCKCEELLNSCTCIVLECECNKSINCWCCLYNNWEQIDSKHSLTFNFINYYNEINKLKSVPKLFKKGIKSLLNDLKQNNNSLNNLNKTDYMNLIDSKFDPVKIASIIEEDNIAKLIYFINKLEFYVEMSIILIEMNKTLDYEISYLEIFSVSDAIEELIPSIVKVFASIEKTLDSSVEYETLKEKLYSFDVVSTNLRSMLDIKILNNR